MFNGWSAGLTKARPAWQWGVPERQEHVWFLRTSLRTLSSWARWSTPFQVPISIACICPQDIHPQNPLSSSQASFVALALRPPLAVCFVVHVDSFWRQSGKFIWYRPNPFWDKNHCALPCTTMFLFMSFLFYTRPLFLQCWFFKPCFGTCTFVSPTCPDQDGHKLALDKHSLHY